MDKSTVYVIHIPCDTCEACNHIALACGESPPSSNLANAIQITLGSKEFYAMPIAALHALSSLMPITCVECDTEIPITIAIVGTATPPSSSSTTLH